MCGRFTITAPSDEMLEHFELSVHDGALWGELTPRYNIAPTQDIPVVAASRSSQAVSTASRLESRSDTPRR